MSYQIYHDMSLKMIFRDFQPLANCLHFKQATLSVFQPCCTAIAFMECNPCFTVK